jgi:hypothetical protein
LSAHDTTLFIRASSRGRSLLLYVGDMIIIGDNSEYIAFVKAHPSEQFSCMVLGLFVTFLRTEVSSTSDGLYMSHGKYIQDLVDRFFTIPNILELYR